ncbi:RpiR family transcriptional regulator [Anaerostipes sp. 494a]|uniref:MurR/RpiR family transcriptional regulator n=1 Tax=Anaerostipes sp. 494a TaxID=1261636 RepID=UPI000952A402|nr:MurR/RpiR family transcriptional regulator [Anaerostipes sp. 494a]MDY2726903.1 MurR/RpiR family transcriptional regulator [Anaerostipes faecalis]OLR59771.1 RpiR family transcriptional regulator [Anaerostipes sp. 494a]
MKLEELVNKYYRQLNENDLHIWNYISNHRKECEKLAIDQLAYKCNVSRTTILRFAQKLSLKGYGELKVLLKLDNQKAKENLDDVDAISQSYQMVVDNIKNLDCTEIFRKMDSARNIYIYGIGMIQSSIKREFKRLFMTAGIIVYNLSGYAEAESVLDTVNDEDLFFMISVRGENQFVLDFAKKLKVRNVPIVSITCLRDNRLSHLCDYNLYTADTNVQCIFTDEGYVSLTTYFILMEIFFLKYEQYKHEKKGKVEDHAVRRND